MKTENYLMVDFENISVVSLSNHSRIAKILIFVGRLQTKIDFDLVDLTHSLEKKVQWIKIEGDGKNALDFHIAFYLGQISSEKKAVKFFVLSKDKGFDPLIHHLHTLKIECQRITNVQEIEGGPSSNGATIEDVIRHLSTIQRNNRPRKRKTLETFISSSFKALGETVIEDAINMLFEKRLAQEDASGKITYLS